MTPPVAPITLALPQTAAFIGHAPGYELPAGQITRFSSWLEFRAHARLSPNSGRAWNNLTHAIYGFFENGGGRCLVVDCDPAVESELAAALAALTAQDDVLCVAAPGSHEAVTYAALTDHCEALRDRMAILDGPADLTDAHLKVIGGLAREADGWTMPPRTPNGYTTLYMPWIRVPDPEGSAGTTVFAPACGHIAGLWARHDTTTGVHKAPANLGLSGALNTARRFTPAEQDLLNLNGVNSLRVFPGRGVVVWGARTLSSDPEWRYISVRRYATLITQSICRATGWVVFEPNDEPLWAQLRATVEDFLFGLWRTGTLSGQTPQQAYFVRCDRSTMTQADLDEGRVTMLVGVALLRPAEFTNLHFSWTAAGCTAT